MLYIEMIIKTLMAHCVGDYVFQTQYIADGKRANPWLLFVHSVLYAVPFLLFINDYSLIALLILTHIIVDALKIKGIISYAADQAIHIIVALLLYWVQLIGQ